MKCFLSHIVLLLSLLFVHGKATSQLYVANNANATDLAYRLVGEGVTISNVRFTGNPLMTGFFTHAGGTSLGIDSGIVLTTGLAKSGRLGSVGVNGDGSTMAVLTDADNSWSLAGDPDLALAISAPVDRLFDACVLEFDFIPLGDSIRFDYVFSSEEYTPSFVCTFNDAFAFFISGPGITGLKNIALVPGTNTPVSIFNVNDVPGGTCPNNMTYYNDNATNTLLTHDGHTTVLTARQKVQPCNTYHLKLVISDVEDDLYDSGVFLSAKSLSSNAVTADASTLTDPTDGGKYLVEGCANGTLFINRDKVETFPQVITLAYGGSANNGSDISPLPLTVTIPGGSRQTALPLQVLQDRVTEGTELLKIFTITGCTAGLPSDSVIISLRDYDHLQLTPDTLTICKDYTVQLDAPAGYTAYAWNKPHLLSDATSKNPVARPASALTVFTCTAHTGDCYAQDSVVVKWLQPVLRLFAGNDTVAVMDVPIQLQAVDLNNSGVVSYQWSPAINLDNAAIGNPVARLQADQRYVVTAVNTDGCVAKDDILIKVYKGPEIYVPSAFTPDNNGLNDLLLPVPVGIKQFHYFRVFNRWGNLVFSTTDPKRGWDGLINRVQQATGTFIWTAQGLDYKGNVLTRKGSVTVIR